MGSSPAEGMDVLLLCLWCCVGSGLYDELITRSEESYRVSVCVCVCVIVCDLETSTMGRPRTELDFFAKKKKSHYPIDCNVEGWRM